MKREKFTVTEDQIDDYTSEGPWEIDGITYTFVETFRIDGDGEWYGVVVKRQTDGKYFQFAWGYGDTKDYYEPQWDEVKEKKVTTTRYCWF